MEKYRIVLPKEIVNAIQNRCRERKTRFSASLLCLDIKSYIKKGLRSDSLNEKLWYYYSFEENQPSVDFIERALNFKGKAKKQLHGIDCDGDNYFVNLLCYYGLGTSWLKALDKFGISEEQCIIKHGSRKSRERLDQTEWDLPRMIEYKGQIEVLIENQKWDEVDLLYKQILQEEISYLDRFNEAVIKLCYFRAFRHKTNDPNQQLTFLLGVISELQKVGANWHLAVAYSQIMRVYQRLGQLDQLRIYGELLTSTEFESKVYDQLNCAFNNLHFAMLLFDSKDFDNAHKYFDRTIAFAMQMSAAGDKENREIGFSLLGIAYGHKCAIYSDEDNLVKAKAYSIKSIQAYSRVVTSDVSSGVGMALYHRSAIEFREKGRLDEKFTQWLWEAKSSCLKGGNWNTLLLCFILELKDLIKQKYSVDYVRTVLDAAFETIKAVDEPLKRAGFLKMFGDLSGLFQLEDYKVRYFIELNNFAAQNYLTQYIIECYRSLPELYEGVPEGYLDSLIEKLIEDCTDDKRPDQLASIFLCLAQAYRYLENYERAIAAYSTLLEQYERSLSISMYVMICVEQSDTYMCISDYISATVLLQSVSGVIKGSSEHTLNALTHLRLSFACSMLHNFELAQANLSYAKLLIERFNISQLGQYLEMAEGILVAFHRGDKK